MNTAIVRIYEGNTTRTYEVEFKTQQSLKAFETAFRNGAYSSPEVLRVVEQSTKPDEQPVRNVFENTEQ